MASTAKDRFSSMRTFFGVDRVRLVHMGDPEQLASTRSDEPVHVELMEGVEYTLAGSEFTTLDNGRRRWRARMERTHPPGSPSPRPGRTLAGDDLVWAEIHLLWDPAGWYGSINTPEGLFHLRPLPGGLHALAHRDWADFPNDEGETGDSTLNETPPPCEPWQEWCQGGGGGGGGSPPPPPPPPPSASIIDVLVAYTPAGHALALNYAPSFGAFVGLAEDETNASYARSFAGNAHIEVVTTVSTDAGYGDTAYDVAALLNLSDGIFDNVPPARESNAADVVVLIGSYGGGACGRAAVIQANAGNAYVTVNATCATGYYSFGHEIGHLFGARHDLDEDPTLTPYAYGHGYVKRNPWYWPFGSQWRTVMAYGGGIQRIPYWSNPDVDYPNPGDHSTGSYDREDNARVLDLRAAALAAFRSGAGRQAGEAAVATAPVAASAANTADLTTFALRATPNPSAGHAVLSFGAAENVEARLTVYDALGRRVAVLHDGPASAGLHRADFDATRLPSGVYACRLEAGSRVEIIRLTVTH